MTRQFAAAVISSSFGVSGAVKARSLSGEISHLLTLPSLTLRLQTGGERRFEVESASPFGRARDAVLYKLRGVESPEQAKTLSGAEILVTREQAAPLSPGEYYIEDLKNLSVEDENGVYLGKITDIVEGGGGFLAEILLPSGKKVFAPFREGYFDKIDIEKGLAVLLEPWILR